MNNRIVLFVILCFVFVMDTYNNLIRYLICNCYSSSSDERVEPRFDPVSDITGGTLNLFAMV